MGDDVDSNLGTAGLETGGSLLLDIPDSGLQCCDHS